MKLTYNPAEPSMLCIVSESAGDNFKLGKIAAKVAGIWAGEVGDGRYVIRCPLEDFLKLALQACKP